MTAPDTINWITKRVVVGPLIVWAIWEVTIGVLRRKYGTDVKWISQIARDLAFKGFTSLAYFGGGLPFHLYVTWRGSPPDGRLGTILGATWWAIGLAYLVADIFDPTPRYWPALAQHLRYPPWVVIGSALLAFLCFAQRGLWTPGGAK